MVRVWRGSQLRLEASCTRLDPLQVCRYERDRLITKGNFVQLKKLALASLVSGALCVFGAPAHAILILNINDGAGNSLSISDGSALDADTDAGSVAVAYNTTVGAWKLSGVAGAASVDPTGLHLNSWTVTNNAFTSGTLRISFSDTGLSGPRSNIYSGVGGYTSEAGAAGGAKFETYVNGVLISTLGTFSGGAFSGEIGVSGIGGTGAYTLEQVAYIKHTGSGSTSFDMQTNVPEPATLALLGLGLLGLGFSSRRKTA